MNVEQKIAEARQNLAERAKERAVRKTWRQKMGFFRIMWIFGWGVLAGAAWFNFLTDFKNTITATKTVIIINKAEAKTVESPEKLEMDEPAVVSVSDIADDIWTKESSRGVNNYSKCAALGKVNGIGYGIYGEKWQCFKDHDEEMAVLKGWITDKRARGMSDNELMCLYSGGNYKFCK